MRSLPPIRVVRFWTQPHLDHLSLSLKSLLCLLGVSQEGALAGSEHLFSHVPSFLQSLLWWLPVERAFWRQVRVGSSTLFSPPVDSWEAWLP